MSPEPSLVLAWTGYQDLNAATNGGADRREMDGVGKRAQEQALLQGLEL